MSKIIATDKRNPPTPLQHAASIWPMYRALVGLGIICAALIAVSFLLTREPIKNKQAAFVEQAVFKVLPGTTQQGSFELNSEGSFQAVTTQTEQTLFAGYDEQGKLTGLAIQAKGMGYQDTIRLLYGYSPEKQAIVGLQILASKETPGLGDKIATSPAFHANFDHLPVPLNTDNSGLKHGIVAVKNGNKTQDWQIDGITGATISSLAVASIIERSANQWLPMIQKRIGDFKRRDQSINETATDEQ